MAMFAAAAMQAIGSTVAAAGSTAAATAATAATTAATTTAAAALPAAASAGSTFLSILQGAGALLSAGATLAAGREEARALRSQAADTRLQQQRDVIETTDRRARMKQLFAQEAAERDLAYAASGIDTSFGTPAVARVQASDDAERALGVEDSTTRFGLARLDQKRSALMAEARSVRRRSMFEAVSGLVSTGIDMARRG
jgi:hypothetical protein